MKDNVMGIFFTICVILLVLAFWLAFALIILGGTVCRKSIGHDLFGWHDCEPDDQNAKVKTGICRYCDGKCEMDYEGNWHLMQNPDVA